MSIVELTISFQLPGCASLKEKRSRLRRLSDRFGRDPNIAVSESDFHDQWQRACWTFVIIGNDRRFIAARCSAIENFCHQLDAYVTDRQLRELA